MVSVITENEDLYSQDPDLFISKINYIFEPMVDFRRVGASVMGKKYYLAATKEQRIEFIEAFKSSLLNTYSSTLAQWGDQKIETIFPDEVNSTKVVDVQQNLITSSNIYPIIYKVRNDGSGNWLIINIIVNGVNLGLTFRNQFQALATEHSENVDLIIQNWTSDANL
jgi:phospholipid transport system substrate-binding protein